MEKGKFVNVRFLKPGLIKMPVDESFFELSIDEQERIASEFLDSKDNSELTESMRDVKGYNLIDDMFDDVPKVECIEYDLDEGSNGISTKTWTDFAFGTVEDRTLLKMKNGQISKEM